MSFQDEVEQIFSEVKDLLEKKHKMYGERNLEITGLLGISTRIMDKAARLHQLAVYGNSNEEGVEDTLKDIIGYAVNALRLYRKDRLSGRGLLGGEDDE